MVSSLYFYKTKVTEVGTANALNVDFDKISSWIATISSKTREESEVIGNSLKNIMARFQQLRQKGFAEEDGTQVNMVAKALNEVGIQIMDTEGNFENFGTVMDKLGAKWKTLDNRHKAYISTQMAGAQQSARFLNLMESYDDSVKLYEGALNSAGATQAKYNTWLQGTEAHLNTLRATTEEFYMNTFNSDSIKDVIDVMTGLVSTLDGVVQHYGALKLAVFSALLGLQLFKQQFALIKMEANGALSGVLPKLVSSIKGFGGQLEKAKIELQESGRATTGFIGKLNILRSTTLAQTIATGALRAVTFALNTALTMGLSAIISLLVTKMASMVKSTADLRQETEELMATYQQNVQTNNSNISAINSLSKEYETLSEKTSLSADEHKRFAEIRNQIAQISPELISGYDEEGNATLNLKGGLEDVVKLLKEKNILENQKLVAKGDDAFKSMKKDLKEANEELTKLEAKQKQYYTYIPANDGSGQMKLLTTYEEISRAYDEIDDKQSETGLKLHARLLEIGNDLKNNKTSMDVQASAIKNAQGRFTEYAMAVAKGESKFAGMNNAVKEFAQAQVQALDYSKMEDWNQATSEIRNVIGKLATEDGTKLVESMNDINNQYKDGTLSTEQYRGQIEAIINAFAVLLNMPTDKIRDLIQIDVSKLTSGAEGVDVVQKTIERFAQSIKDASSDISNINEVLDKHAQSGEWNLENIVKLSATYPQLLDKLDDEKTLEQELINIKNNRINSSKDILAKQIKNEETYLTEIFKGYGLDVANYQSAQEAKLAMANQFATRVEALNAQIIASDSAREDAIGSKDQEAYELALKKRAMIAGLQSSMAGYQAKIDTHIDNYFKLQKIYLNADKFLGTGSKNNDGKSSKDTASSYESATKSLDKFLAYLKDINEQLETQKGVISDIEKQASYFKSIGDKNSMLKALEEENKLYAQQEKLMRMLKNDVSLIESSKDVIGKTFKDNFSSMANIDFASWTESDFQKKFEELFPSRTFSEKTQQEAYDKQKELFQQLVDDWFQYSDQIKSLNNEIEDTQTQLIETMKKKYETYFDVLGMEFDKINEQIDDVKYNMDMLDDGENYSQREQYAQQLVADTREYRDSIQEAIDKLNAKKNTLQENSAEWNVVNNQIKEYKKSLEDANLQLKDAKDLVEEIRQEQIDVSMSLQDKIVSALRDKYNKEKEKELDAISERKKVESDRLTAEIEELRAELEALQDDTTEKEENLARKKELLALWQKDDSAYAQGKAKQLQAEIADLEKDLAIKQLEDKIKTKEDELSAVEDSAGKETEAVNNHYDELLDEQTIYEEASSIMAGKTQDEILEILLSYDEKYKGMGTTLGKAYADALLAEIQRAKDALKELENGVPDIPAPSSDVQIPDIPSTPPTEPLPTPPVAPPPTTQAPTTSTPTTNTSTSESIPWDGRYYRTGSRGDTVKRIQSNLNANGYNLSVDGIFGTKTKNAVVSFQSRNGLSADGIIGRNTWEKLIKFDTGGYTGAFGDDGKLAVLHEKERVLNQTQTKAFEHLIYDILPKFSFDYLSKFNESMLEKGMVFNAPVVQNDIKITNNTPFDVENSVNNINKAIKEELKISGYKIGLT